VTTTTVAEPTGAVGHPRPAAGTPEPQRRAPRRTGEPEAPAAAPTSEPDGPPRPREPDTASCTFEPEPAAPAPEDLAARIARLLDRKAQHRPEELGLAEAICAVKWPRWPASQGGIDLVHLRDVLQGIRIDAAALNGLGGREIQKACREAARAGSNS